jgi:hypothetical protein
MDINSKDLNHEKINILIRFSLKKTKKKSIQQIPGDFCGPNRVLNLLEKISWGFFSIKGVETSFSTLIFKSNDCAVSCEQCHDDSRMNKI